MNKYWVRAVHEIFVTCYIMKIMFIAEGYTYMGGDS